MKTLPKINFINLISDFNQATWKKYKKKILYGKSNSSKANFLRHHQDVTKKLQDSIPKKGTNILLIQKIAVNKKKMVWEFFTRKLEEIR